MTFCLGQESPSEEGGTLGDYPPLASDSGPVDLRVLRRSSSLSSLSLSGDILGVTQRYTKGTVDLRREVAGFHREEKGAQVPLWREESLTLFFYPKRTPTLTPKGKVFAR